MAKPNIILILIDDLGVSDLGCYGSTFYETPRLDTFAQEGVTFTNAYASCPVCSPTRASILTGKYPARVGVTQWIGGHNEGKLKDVPYLHYLPLEEKSLASALKENGYATWHVGKWHLGDTDFHPEKHGFDVNIGGSHWGYPHNGHFSPWKLPNLPDDGPAGEYLADRLTDEAIKLIRNRKDGPFFLNLWQYAVHIAIQAPEPLVEKYRKKAKERGLDKKEPFVTGEKFHHLSCKDYDIVRRTFQSDPVYAAMVENMDWNVGRVLDVLDEEGLTDDTMVIFASDNGGLSTAQGSPTCNAPFSEGKGWSQEGGTRVCQMIRWPGRIKKGTMTDEAVTSTDIYPTVLDAAGLAPMPLQHVDGVNLMPVMTAQAKLERKAIFWHYPHYADQGGTPASSVVSGQWKLIESFEEGRLYLYNLAVDPGEKNNLADTNPAIRDELYSLLKDWQRDVEAQIPKPNPEYEKQLHMPNIPNNAHE